MGWLERLETKSESEPFTPASAAYDRHFLPLTTVNYGGLVRNGLDSNVVMSPIQWIMRAFPEATPITERKVGPNRPWDEMDEHPVSELLRRPNPWYNGGRLFQSTVLSYVIDGNAYWLKRRNEFGMVVELWYVPHWMMEPKWPADGSVFISHYEYTPIEGRPPVPLLPSDVVHFRFGLDPRNTRKGWSQVKTLMREVYTDEQAANFSASILKNQGVPGMLVAPKFEGSQATPEDVQEIKRELDAKTRGEKVGSTVVMSGPTEVVQFGFDPNRLDLSRMRDVSEERVCAALGLPAAVVGFGTGLQSTKVGATMREMRQMAWVQCLIPIQTDFGSDIGTYLIPEFETLPHRWRVRFDRSQVSAFQEEETERATRLKTLVEAGILQVADAQDLANLPVDESQRVYLRAGTVVAIAKGDAALAKEEPEPEPKPAPATPIEPAPTDAKALMAEAAVAIDRFKKMIRNGTDSGHAA